jgi:hypothetical protein
MKSGTLDRKPHPSRSAVDAVAGRGALILVIMVLVNVALQAAIDISPADAQRIGKRI